MKLNINKNSIQIIDKQKSPIITRETIKGTEVVPFIENSKFYCIIGDNKYEVVVENNYIPLYRFSTIENDKYLPNTIKQAFKEIHYLNLSKYWTYLSTTIVIKVNVIDGKAFAKTNMLNYTYSIAYKKYSKDEYRKRNKT